jgi:hypothetical protein
LIKLVKGRKETVLLEKRLVMLRLHRLNKHNSNNLFPLTLKQKTGLQKMVGLEQTSP